MKIYLDTSVLNRIFDDQSQPRIFLEATSAIMIFLFVEHEIVEIVSSDALIFENSKNPFEQRKVFVNAVLNKARFFQVVDEKILGKAQEKEKQGIKGIDALHIACAEESEVDYFITCDDRVTRKYKGNLKVTTPTEFVLRILKEERNENN